MSKGSKVFFSVVIPTYNRGDIIEITLQSLLNQSYKHFEIIVVDDGGTDNTEEVVSKISDERIRYFKKENAERGAARNFGARHTKGDYINFFDSDDVALPIHLQTAYEFIEQNNYPEMLHLGYNVISPDGKVISEMNKLSGNINELLFLKGNFFSCNGVFLRRDIAALHPFIEDRNLAASEDAVLWMLLAARYKWNYSNVITSSIVNHIQRSVVNINKQKLLTRLSLFVKHVTSDVAVQEKFPYAISGVELEAWSYAALHFALTGVNKSDALKYWFRCAGISKAFIFSRRSAAIIKRLIF